jgi:spore coat protein CotH
VIKHRLSLLVGIFAALCATAQDGSQVFNDTVLHRIEISIDLPNWFDTLALDYDRNRDTPDSFPEVYRRCDVVFDGKWLQNVGFREKGNFSNIVTEGKKQPYKIKFDEFEDQKLDGIKKIDLKNFINDPSLLHEPLAYKLLRDRGIPAPRTAYAELWVNGAYWGLYLLVENIDKPFLKRYFGGGANDEGNLFRAGREFAVNLDYLGPDKETYKEKGLVLSNNEAEDDWSGLIRFLDVVTNTPTGDIPVELPKVFDVQTFIKMIAVERLLKAWDNFSFAGSNFYLYQHPDGRFRMIPWDYNETFQDIRLLSATDWLEGYLVPNGDILDRRPLLRRIFEQEAWKQQYFEEVCALLQSDFTVEHMARPVPKWRSLVDTAYLNDPHKINTYADFAASLTDTHTDVIGFGAYDMEFRYPGIFPFIVSRRAWALDQLEGWLFDCAAAAETRCYDLRLFPNPTSSHVFWKNNTPDTADFSGIVVLNTLGQAVLQSPARLRNGSEGFALGSLPGGIYTLLKKDVNGDLGVGRFVVR